MKWRITILWIKNIYFILKTQMSKLSNKRVMVPQFLTDLTCLEEESIAPITPDSDHAEKDNMSQIFK